MATKAMTDNSVIRRSMLERRLQRFDADLSRAIQKFIELHVRAALEAERDKRWHRWLWLGFRRRIRGR